MKKTYKKPQMEVVKIQTGQMLASSPGYGGTTDATEGNLSREFDIEDDSELLDDDTVLDI